MNGVTIPNNSIVDTDDVLYTTREDNEPTNSRPIQHDRAVLCVTDLLDCCDREGIGNWYFPNGTRVLHYTWKGYVSNRGQNELRDGRQFYGSVRLYRFYSSRVRGLFRCELPDANNVAQTLYANIGKIRIAIHVGTRYFKLLST